MSEKYLRTPLTDEDISTLKAGDQVYITGTIYTGRDTVHKRFVALLDKGEDLPVDLRGQIIYYVGPTPPRPEKGIGSAGPTTSGRMDPYTPKVLKETGLKGMIGKGLRSQDVKKAIVENKAVYFAAVGGAGALIAKSIKKAQVVAYPELGPEALQAFEVENFPVTVINDSYGADLYEEAIEKYKI